ncbi:hypothetical protein [Thomasclavelia cocleata]|nr:hypothetical protein [Thomasclavelia cocleata]
MANENRHLGNFGVIRDVESLQWVAICPIFDTGRSLNNKYWLDEIVDMRFFTNHFVNSETVKQFIDYPINDMVIKKLYQVPIYFKKLLDKYIDELPLKEDDIAILVQAFKQRIALLENINK